MIENNKFDVLFFETSVFTQIIPFWMYCSFGPQFKTGSKHYSGPTEGIVWGQLEPPYLAWELLLAEGGLEPVGQLLTVLMAGNGDPSNQDLEGDRPKGINEQLPIGFTRLPEPWPIVEHPGRKKTPTTPNTLSLSQTKILLPECPPVKSLKSYQIQSHLGL